MSLFDKIKDAKGKLAALSVAGMAVMSHAGETDPAPENGAAGIIQTGLADVDLSSVATTAISTAAIGLAVWVGWRLACKLLNRGVGK